MWQPVQQVYLLFPGFYEMFKKLGAFECTKPCIVMVLRDSRDVAVFPGGATESVYATPGRVCFCKKHKGFVRLAIEERLDHLPMWTFGDESLMPQMRYENVPQLVKALQRWGGEGVLGSSGAADRCRSSEVCACHSCGRSACFA